MVIGPAWRSAGTATRSTRPRRHRPHAAAPARLSTVEIHSPAGPLLVAHRLAPAGAGTIVRSAEQRAALEAVVLSAFTHRPAL